MLLTIYNFIRYSREMHSRTRSRIFSVAQSGRRSRRRCKERSNLARRWSSLNSLGATRSWNVLWKLLWKALRAMDRTGAPSSLLLHTCCHSDERPPETSRSPILILHLSLSFPLLVVPQWDVFSLSILESASFFIIIISVVDISSLARSFSFLLFLSHSSRIYFMTGIFLGCNFFATSMGKLRLTFCKGNGMPTSFAEKTSDGCLNFRLPYLWLIFLKACIFPLPFVQLLSLSAPRWCPLPGQLDLLNFFVLQLSLWVRERWQEGDGEVLLTLDAVQSLQ